jgi:hypothetical protein
VLVTQGQHRQSSCHSSRKVLEPTGLAGAASREAGPPQRSLGRQRQGGRGSPLVISGDCCQPLPTPHPEPGFPAWPVPVETSRVPTPFYCFTAVYCVLTVPTLGSTTPLAFGKGDLGELHPVCLLPAREAASPRGPAGMEASSRRTLSAVHHADATAGVSGLGPGWGELQPILSVGMAGLERLT